MYVLIIYFLKRKSMSNFGIMPAEIKEVENEKSKYVYLLICTICFINRAHRLYFKNSPKLFIIEARKICIIYLNVCKLFSFLLIDLILCTD